MSISAKGFRRGVVAAVPLFLAVAPFGLIFGVLATEAGLDLVETMVMTTIVIAGAAQLATLQLMDDHAPALLAILTGAVVNLRMAMYSASIAAEWPGAPLWARAFAAFFLHDQDFALSMRRYAEKPQEPVEDKIGFYMGVGVATATVWSCASLGGALLGAQAPEAWSLDFAVPITFIAVCAPLLRTAPHVAAATTGVVAALVFAPLPYGMGLMVASTLGVAAGAGVEILMERRRAEA